MAGPATLYFSEALRVFSKDQGRMISNEKAGLLFLLILSTGFEVAEA